MRLEWDEAKRLSNLAKHGVDFALAEQVDWSEVKYFADLRRDYGESRFVVYPTIDGRMYAIVVTPRSEAIRVIGMRKANRREIERHG